MGLSWLLFRKFYPCDDESYDEPSLQAPCHYFHCTGYHSISAWGAAYEATRLLVTNAYTPAVNQFLEVTLTSGAIAFGILCAEIFYYIYTRLKHAYGKLKGKHYRKGYHMNNRI